MPSSKEPFEGRYKVGVAADMVFVGVVYEVGPYAWSSSHVCVRVRACVGAATVLRLCERDMWMSMICGDEWYSSAGYTMYSSSAHSLSY